VVAGPVGWHRWIEVSQRQPLLAEHTVEDELARFGGGANVAATISRPATKADINLKKRDPRDTRVSLRECPM